MANLSQLENQILNGIIKSDFQDEKTFKEDLVNTIVYINRKDVNMDNNEFASALKSCIEKGLVSADNTFDKYDYEIAITELGWNQLNK